MGNTYRLLAATLLALPSTGWAQTRSEVLADAWREARRAELAADRARIDAQLAALATATPDMPTPAGPVAPGHPAALPPPAAADAAGQPDAGGADKDASETDTGKPDDEKKGGRRSFGGLDLGVGLSFTLDLGKLDRISEASIVDGVVRVDDQDNGRARIMLESHYFLTPCWRLFGMTNPCGRDRRGIYRARTGEERWGFGPFVAVQPGSGEIIDAIGMGIMVGMRREGSDQSFNFGVGVVVDPNTRVLGDGFRENRPPPGAETEVRFRETLQTGILLLSSFSF